MLLRWDVEKPDQLVVMTTPMPDWEGCGYVESDEGSTFKVGDRKTSRGFRVPDAQPVLPAVQSSSQQPESLVPVESQEPEASEDPANSQDQGEEAKPSTEERKAEKKRKRSERRERRRAAKKR